MISLILKGVSQLIAPPICLHCRCETEDQNKLLCPPCAQMLQLINSERRCAHCFSNRRVRRGQKCSRCISYQLHTTARAAAVENSPPARALLAQGGAEVACAIAALLYLQLQHLPWEASDAIIPLPGDELIADELSSLTAIPAKRLLKGEQPYDWRKQEPHIGQSILLISAGNSTHERTTQAAKKMKELFPQKIYALQFLSSF